ncbi:hypothetical protein BHM03_00046988 [Ensete ventricosum]|nr:hypothetical protein BHM03_00046988 [Ensete ventricosum]
MPTWLWCWCGPSYDSDVNMVVELMWAPMDWAGPLSALSSSPSPRRRAFGSLLLNARKAPVESQRFEYPMMCDDPKVGGGRLGIVSSTLAMAPMPTLYIESRSPSENAKTQVRQMETELLELTQSKDALRMDLSRQAIKDYKKSSGFEMGLVRMG